MINQKISPPAANRKAQKPRKNGNLTRNSSTVATQAPQPENFPLPRYSDHEYYPLGCGIRQAIWEILKELWAEGLSAAEIWEFVLQSYPGLTSRELTFVAAEVGPLEGGAA